MCLVLLCDPIASRQFVKLLKMFYKTKFNQLQIFLPLHVCRTCQNSGRRNQCPSAVKGHLRICKSDVYIIWHVNHQFRVKHCAGKLQRKTKKVKQTFIVKRFAALPQFEAPAVRRQTTSFRVRRTLQERLNQLKRDE